MQTLRQTAKPVSVVVILSLVFLIVPFEPCLAGLIGTEAVLDEGLGQGARQQVRHFLEREDVQKVLTARGIGPEEAKARLDALSDREVLLLSKQLDQLPAGGDGFTVFIFAVLFVFIVLLFTDIAGYTDVFPFVKKPAR